MPVLYDSKALIPAPFITVSQETLEQEDGTRIGSVYTITVRGKLVAWKGSPNSAGTFWAGSGYPPDETIGVDSRLTAVLKKQQAIRDLFATDGKSFEVSGYDGFTPLKCNPRVKRVVFPDGEGKGANWTETCEYEITLEADYVVGLTGSDVPTALVSKVTEEWDVEILDEAKKTYRLTHSLSATGRRAFDETGALLDGKSAADNALAYLLTAVGLGLNAAMMQAPGVLDLTGLQAFNYVRGQHVNETAGIASLTETWVCYDPQGQAPAVHEQTVTVRTSNNDARVSVQIEGTVTGLEQRDTGTWAFKVSRYDNANAKWTANVQPNLLAVAQAASAETAGVATLHPVPAQAAVGKNQVAGTVTYQYEYDNRPVPTTPYALSEIVTVTNGYPPDLFAVIPIPGRPVGPLLQGMGTVGVKRRTINIEIQMPAGTTTYAAPAPATGGIVLALMPGGGAFVEQDEESWTPTTGRYNRSTTFIFE